MSDKLMNKYRDANILQAGAKLLGTAPKDDPDTVRFIREVDNAIKGIKAHAHSIKAAAQLGGQDTTAKLFREQLTEDLNQKFLELFMNYNREEIAMITAHWWTLAVMKETV